MAAATAVAIDPKQYVADAVKKITALATLPEVTNQIIATVEDPKASAATLHKIVAHDPALVSRILKVVNSAFYGLPGQIGSIERAIVLLGLNAVKNIAVAASLGQMFRGVRLTEEFTAKDLWTHCMAVAVTSRELARQMRLPIADEAFLAGMVHDLGLLVSLQVSPEQLRAACERAKSSETSFCEIEREFVGVDHQQLGQGLAEHWKFPRSVQLVAGHHHNPAALSDQNRLLVTLVYAADTICCQANRGFNLTALRQRIDDAEIASVKLDLVLIEHTRQNLPALLEGASSMMG